MPGFAIHTDKFEGPLELLLDLVEKRRMHISDVSLSDVADKFLAHIETLGGLPVANTANFVYVASILLLIKSKSLLPELNLSTEEEASIGELEKRLALLQILRGQTGIISEIWGKSIIYRREDSSEIHIVFSPPESLDRNAMTALIRDIISRIPKGEELEQKIVQKVISLDEMIESLAERIQSNLQLSFREFSKMEREEKVGVIVSFLAMLELVRRGAMSVKQHSDFGDIEMESIEASVPT